MDRSNRVTAKLTLPAPRELDVRFVVHDGVELAVLSFALDDVVLPAQLTAAEKDVVASLMKGQSSKDIARERGRAPRTIANQIASVFKKLGVRSRSELVARLARTKAKTPSPMLGPAS